MVRMGGLEPPCLRTRPSNVRVYQFHHIRSEGVTTLWRIKGQLFHGEKLKKHNSLKIYNIYKLLCLVESISSFYDNV